MSLGMNIDNVSVEDLFKTVFLNVMNSQTNESYPILGMVKRDTSLTGKVQAHLVKFADTGGFSMGSIGEASDSDYKQTNYEAKRAYQVGNIDAASMDLARNDSGAFKRLLSETIANMHASNTRNWARMLMGNGDGSLGTIEAGGVTDNGSGNYSIIITSDTFVRSRFRKREQINIESGNVDLFRVDSVDKNTRAVTVQRLDGSKVPADGDVCFRQKSEDQDVEGLQGVLDATSGSKYGITIGDGWRAEQVDAAGRPIDSAIISEAMWNVFDEFGEAPDMLVVGSTQMKKLIQLGESNKILTYNDVTENNFTLNNVPHLRFRGKEVPIIYDQGVQSSRAYLLNKNHIVIRTAGTANFVEGTDGFLHYQGATGNGRDEYKLVYRNVGEIFINPTAHAVITGLSTTTM